MDKLRTEVSELLDAIESRTAQRFNQSPLPIDPRSSSQIYLSPQPQPRSRVSETPLNAALVGLRGALREAERRNAALAAENAALRIRAEAAEREVATRRLIQRSHAETSRIKRVHVNEKAELIRDVARMREERTKMLEDIASLMAIVRRKLP